MDKKKLNNEIILCRAAVRRARVAVIRKILKKMKILKTCQNDALKQKKLQKSERLFEKVQIMKGVKDDEVTKFALRNKDLEGFLKEGPARLRENALACLAKHEAVAKRVRNIREQVPNWETHLPILLDTMGKRKIGKPAEENKSEDEQMKMLKRKKNENSKVKKKVNPSKEGGSLKKLRQTVRCSETSENKEEKEGVKDQVSKPQSSVEKIDDPFFIQKKIIMPKLLAEKPSENNDKIREERNSSFMFHTKPFEVKKDFKKLNKRVQVRSVQEEKLHPSWAAKKVQLIKPFQGTKIKFSED